MIHAHVEAAKSINIAAEEIDDFMHSNLFAVHFLLSRHRFVCRDHRRFCLDLDYGWNLVWNLCNPSLVWQGDGIAAYQYM